MSSQTPDFSVRDSQQESRPSSELDIYDRVVQPSSNDDFLGDVNLGDGNYSDKEYWQQVQAFPKGLYGEAAFATLLLERAIEHAKRQLAADQYDTLNPEDREGRSKRAYVREHKDDHWQALGPHPDDVDDEEVYQEQTLEAQMGELERRSGVTEEWVPPHWRMLIMRHDASRSRDARLMDNLFGRVSEKITNDPSEEARKRLNRLTNGGAGK